MNYQLDWRFSSFWSCLRRIWSTFPSSNKKTPKLYGKLIDVLWRRKRKFGFRNKNNIPTSHNVCKWMLWPRTRCRRKRAPDPALFTRAEAVHVPTPPAGCLPIFDIRHHSGSLWEFSRVRFPRRSSVVSQFHNGTIQYYVPRTMPIRKLLNLLNNKGLDNSRLDVNISMIFKVGTRNTF